MALMKWQIRPIITRKYLDFLYFSGTSGEEKRLDTVEAPHTDKSHAEQIEANEHSSRTTPPGSFLTFPQSPPTRRHRQTVVGRTGRQSLGSRLNKQQK